jgi:nicotinamide mononucleotide transporter
MNVLLELLATQAAALSALEAVAVVLAILYLLLAIREHIGCWYAAGGSTAIYVWLFLDARLYMESALNVFYFGMAIYGWLVWHRGRDATHELPVTAWPFALHVRAIASIAALSLGSGYALDNWTDAEFPYIDSMTTWSAIWATFLVARKVLENWWYWLAIDLVSILIYWARDLQLTALLFAVYVIMIPFGLYRWSRSRRAAAA